MNNADGQRARMDINRQVQALFRDLRKIPERHLDMKARKKLSEKAAKPVIKSVRVSAPVDTGGLKMSVKILRKMKNKGVTFVGPQYQGKGRRLKYAGNHAYFSEYGTRKWNSPHKGWFRRGVEAARNQSLHIMMEEVSKALKRYKQRYGF